MVNKRTSHMCIAHRHRPNSQQQLHEVTNTCRPTCLLFETMQNSDNYVKNNLLMLPELLRVDNCTAASCPHSLSATGGRRAVHANIIETRASIPCHSQWSHQTLLKLFDFSFSMPTADDDVGGRGGKTGHRLTPARCRVCWPPASHVA